MKAQNNEASRVQIALYEPRVKIIQQVIAGYFGITLHELQAHTRKGSSIQARKRVHFFCREIMPKCPFAIIGLLTGNGRAFDHAAVYHSAMNYEKELNLKDRSGKRVYPEICEEVIDLRMKIRNAIEVTKENIECCPTCGRFIFKDIES
jgi:chromosomal replication initiation ATPase DnaA